MILTKWQEDLGRWLNCLPGKQEDLSSVPGTHIRFRCDGMCLESHVSTGSVETGGMGGLLGAHRQISLTYLVISRSAKDLSKQVSSTEEH